MILGVSTHSDIQGTGFLNWIQQRKRSNEEVRVWPFPPDIRAGTRMCQSRVFSRESSTSETGAC